MVFFAIFYFIFQGRKVTCDTVFTPDWIKIVPFSCPLLDHFFANDRVQLKRAFKYEIVRPAKVEQFFVCFSSNFRPVCHFRYVALGRGFLKPRLHMERARWF